MTKQQLKRLRWLCSNLQNDTPFTKKYTILGEKRHRTIGIFEYVENGNALESFSVNGKNWDLSGVVGTAFLGRVEGLRGKLNDVAPAVANTSEYFLRELTMTAAAREAVSKCGLREVAGNSTAIYKEYAANVPFCERYALYLRKAGRPLTIDEICEVFPNQAEWVRAEAPK